MSDEVKRWETISIDTKIPGTRFDVDDVPRVTVISADDHDRIVAQKDGELLTFYRMAASGVWIESEKYDELLKTIASQKRVIERSRQLYLNAVALLDERTADKTYSIDDVLARYDAEIAAIEKGES